MLIIKSRLGSTDCSGCRMFRRGAKILAKRAKQPGEKRSTSVLSLPIKVADLPSVEAAEVALERITYAIVTGQTVVNLTDLEP